MAQPKSVSFERDAATLAPPDLKYEYFQFCSDYPFEPGDAGYSARNAWWLAEAAFAAYGDFPQNGRANLHIAPLTAAGYTVSAEVAGTVQMLVIENAEAIIVAFRGTRVDGIQFPFLSPNAYAIHWSDFITDARFAPKNLDGNAFVHGGILDAYDGIADRLDNIMIWGRRDRPVWFCGHSLGGALASIAAYKHRDRTQGLYTFGSPRVGNDVFADTLNGALRNRYYRFVHNRDFVTTIPPHSLPFAVPLESVAGFLVRFMPPFIQYKHGGTLRYIVGDTSSRVLDGIQALNSLKTMAHVTFASALETADTATPDSETVDFDRLLIGIDALYDHAPIYYAAKLFNVSLSP